MNINLNMRNLIGILVLSVGVMACNNDVDQTARLEVRLTDGPGDYEAVNVDIQGVEVHTDGGGAESGWKSLQVEKGIYDLLKLTDGVDTLLATAELPAGRISQIRLILGENNSIKVGGEEMPLSTPSAQQSGLKLNVHEDLTAGVTYRILLDFDAAKSIVQTGNSNFKLKPVIRAITVAESGAIEGIVEPIAAFPSIFAIIGNDTIASAWPSETGAFLLQGLPVGTYTVAFDPKEGYSPVQKTNVDVTLGKVVNVGLVSIP